MPAQVLMRSGRLWTGPAACAALWGDMLTRDLVGEVRTRLRPPDDPIQYLVVDPRRARTKLSDGLWVRIVDLPAALQRRRYACAVDVVIEVTDPLLAANEGRWRIQAGAPGEGGQAACVRATAPAEVQ